MNYTKKHLKFIAFALILPVFWNVAIAGSDDESPTPPKRSTPSTFAAPANASPAKRSRFWGPQSSDCETDSSAPSSPDFGPISAPASPEAFSLGNSLADIDRALHTALAKDIGSLGISRPATPNDGLVLVTIKKLLIDILHGNHRKWDELIDSIDNLHNMSTIKTLVDDELISLCNNGTLLMFVQHLITHARGIYAPALSGHELQRELSQKLSHPYLALLNLAHKINEQRTEKLTQAELAVPVINYDHIFTPNSETGYHYEDASLNRRVHVHATNPATDVYGGTWRKISGVEKFSNFFPQHMGRDGVCQSIHEAFANQVAESLEINGTAKRVLLGRSSNGTYIEMPTFFGVSVNAYPIFSYTQLPASLGTTWEVTLGDKTYTYAELLGIIKDAVFNHFNDAIRYTSLTRDGREYAIVDKLIIKREVSMLSTSLLTKSGW